MSARIQLPKPSGPYRIGVMDFELTDTSREETFSPGTTRRIPVRAWYPTAAEDGVPRPNAKPAELLHQVAPFFKLIPTSTDVSVLLDVSTHAWEDAPPLMGTRRPVLIFSHGGFACPQTNIMPVEHFASHGYVVLSISHPYVDQATLHENGDIIKCHPSLLEDLTATAAKPSYVAAFSAPDPATRLDAMLTNCHETKMATQFRVWEGDFIHVIDRLHAADLPAKAKALLDIVDLDRLGTFGMSFGGGAAVAAAQRDPRVRAGINLDGGVWDADMLDRDCHAPLLIMHSDLSLLLAAFGITNSHPHSELFHERLATAGTRADIHRVEVSGATHLSFTDLCLIPPELRADPVLAAMIGPIDGQRMATIVNDFCQAFLDHYLSHEGAGLDPAFRANYPEVSDIDLGPVRDWAVTNPVPGFMSYRHVQLMNRILAGDGPSKAAAAKLTRPYLLAYKLIGSPKGRPVWWQMRFDPEAGVSVALGEPQSSADLTLTGDWQEAVQDLAALRYAKKDATLPLKPVGDETLMATLAEAFSAAQKAAAIPTRETK